MSMPKGHKSEFGYSTISDLPGGRGYREISEVMTDRGFKMNHSNARNILMSGLSKIAEGVCSVYGESVNEERLKKITNDPRFQAGIYDMLAERE
jgi:hypothetical protein